MDTPSRYASPEAQRYAKVLDVGVKAGLMLLVLSFAAYMTKTFPPHVAFDQLPKYWGLPVKEFVKATNTPTGWGWLALLPQGDILNLAPIAFLAGLSAICSLAVLPLFARRGERLHLFILVLQVAVLIVAASGILTAGQ